MNALTIGMLASGFGLLWLVLMLVVLVLLISLYQQTRVTAFLWLMTATTIIPMLIRVLTLITPFWLMRWAAERSYPVQTTALVSTTIYGMAALLEAVFLLIAVLKMRTWVGSTGNAKLVVPDEQAGPFYPTR